MANYRKNGNTNSSLEEEVMNDYSDHQAQLCLSNKSLLIYVLCNMQASLNKYSIASFQPEISNKELDWACMELKNLQTYFHFLQWQVALSAIVFLSNAPPIVL